MVCPEIKVQDGVMESGSAGAGVQVGVGGDAEVMVEGARLGAGCGLKGGPPGGRVSAWDNSDAVGLLCPGFAECSAEELKRRKDKQNSGRRAWHQGQ